MQTGYYTVNGITYTDKVKALYASTQCGSQVFWHWHDQFNHVAWTSESPYTLREVYRRRAQQLRDQYKWLVLSFSGGSDSFTVLHSFLHNNIHLDEIFVRWPLKATQKIYTPTALNIDPSNTLSEWELTILPQLNYVRDNFPNTKITVYDCSDDILTTEFNDDQLVIQGDRFNPGYWGKFGSMSETEKIMLDQGQSVCMIFGVDKPQICVKENRVYCYFLDILVNSARALSDRYDRVAEPFFWSPNCPEVTHTQARVIYKHLLNNPKLGELVDWGLPFQMNRKIIWDQAIRPVVYPDYDVRWFQASKEANSIDCKQDSYLWLPENKKQIESWKNAVDNVLSSIDSKFINFEQGRPIGFGGFTSEFYYLGDLPVVM